MLQGAGRQLRLCKGGSEPIPQIDVGGIVRVFQMVGVRVGPEVLRRQRTQRVAAHSLPEAVFPRPTAPGQRAAIPKVEVVRPLHMDVADVLGDVLDLFRPEQRAEGFRGHGGQNVQAAPQGQARVAVILGALVAAAIRAVVLQEAVQTVRRLFHRRLPLLLGGGQQKNGEQNVLGAPARPVAHGFVPVAHPPEMLPEIGRQDAGIQFPFHPGGKARQGGVQLCPQQIAGQGQQGTGLRREQLHDGPGRVRQGQLRRVPDVAVVGGQLPGALLADGPYGFRDGVQKAALMLHTLGADQRTQPGAAGEIGILPGCALSGAEEVPPEGQRQCRDGPGQGFFPGLQKTGPDRLGQALPHGPVCRRGKGPVVRQGVRKVRKTFGNHK